MTRHDWPASFPRVPDEDWTRAPVESLALKYDTVENHGWYSNLEPTVAEAASLLRPGCLVVDYSGGTGILADRLLRAAGALDFGLAIVDASPKFLRLALEKLGADPRVAFRLMRYRAAEKRLDFVDEALGDDLCSRGVDLLVSTNAIHLYYGLDETLAAWHRVVRPGGRVLVQSGNVRNPAMREGEWIIDETVVRLDHEAQRLVREDPRFSAWRATLDDPELMARHRALREKFFLPVRPLAHYLEALGRAGFAVEDVRARRIEARVDDWSQFLATYHEGVLPWAGGSERVEGTAPSPEAVRERLELMRLALEAVFEGRPTFDCCWTYVTCVR